MLNHVWCSLVALGFRLVVFEDIEKSSKNYCFVAFDDPLEGPELSQPPQWNVQTASREVAGNQKGRHHPCLLQDLSCDTARIQGCRECSIASSPD